MAPPSIAFDPLCFQSMESTIRRSQLGAYLSEAYSFLSVQHRSPYVNRMKGAGEGIELLPGEGKYLFVYHTPMFMCAKAPIDAIVARIANMD